MPPVLALSRPTLGPRTANLKRCITVNHVDLGEGKTLSVINLHLEAYSSDEARVRQISRLNEVMEEEYAKGYYVVAGGDFNQNMPSTEDTYPVVDGSTWEPGHFDESDLPEGFTCVYDTSTPTCRLLNQPYDSDSAKTQYYVLDAFIVSPNVTVESVETLDEGFAYSDHNPVRLVASFN